MNTIPPPPQSMTLDVLRHRLRWARNSLRVQEALIRELTETINKVKREQHDGHQR